MITGLPGDLQDLLTRGHAERFDLRFAVLEVLLLAGVLWLEHLDRRESLWARVGRWKFVPRFAIYGLLIYTTFYVSLYQTVQQFIYFQF